ncbi:YHYH protein [Chamaesiphon sp. VAR_69_metabat_338]|uniref:YHYH protein n=1 Tax=Chamaesiphon sp. VAR_69_metabat_338 TaxID=2964704 RepID=UPI00286D87AD|nr:YHYH protein [Chamaesiphon sp. VAR_69_metabat_338]
MKQRFIQLALAICILITTVNWPYIASFGRVGNLPIDRIGLPKVESRSMDLTRLPMGDGRLSSSPKAGWIWPCRVNGSNIGGAHRKGPWIEDRRGTYNLTAKAIVKGTVAWPQQYQMKLQGDKRVFTTNDLPSHPTGIFPITPKENAVAYAYDRNPNSISAQNMRVELPIDPQLAAEATCTPGAIGILNTGSVLFNALDAPGRDALAHEIQDSCQGHPEPSGVYHYHSISTCLDDKTTRNGHSELVGYSLDGFGIYGRHDVGGRVLASADLDACHGHIHDIDWNGKNVKMFHYHATWDFPYTIGCMRGTYKRSDVRAIRGNPVRQPPNGPGGRPPGNRPPPPFGSEDRPPFGSDDRQMPPLLPN